MRKLSLALVGALTLGACTTTDEPPWEQPWEQGTGEVPVAADGNDCAVIAAIAKEHYRFNTTDNRPPPIKFEGDFAPRCDWARHGLAFTAYDPDAPGDPRQRVRWVSFARPVHDGRGAVVETGIMHGPLAGMGYECRVISGFAGWTVPAGSCRNTWVS